MANKAVIEQQLAELSSEEKGNITKIGNYIYKLVPLVLVVSLGLWMLINFNNGDNLKLGLTSWFAMGLIYIVVTRNWVKRKYPYYSDAKWVFLYKVSTYRAYRGRRSRSEYNTIDEATRAKLGEIDLND